MPPDRGVRSFQVRTEERDGHLVLAMSGDLALETAAVVIAALDRAGDAVHPEIVLDLRTLSFVGPGRLRAAVTAETLAGVRGGAAIARLSASAPVEHAAGRISDRRRRRLPARCRSPRGWTTPGAA